jgi:hypothetical protein
MSETDHATKREEEALTPTRDRAKRQTITEVFGRREPEKRRLELMFIPSKAVAS